jgi:hypothetical protein
VGCDGVARCYCSTDWLLDYLFPLCSASFVNEAFKIVKVHGATDEVLARIENFEMCKAAFEKALEMRQGARIILKSKES